MGIVSERAAPTMCGWRSWKGERPVTSEVIRFAAPTMSISPAGQLPHKPAETLQHGLGLTPCIPGRASTWRGWALMEAVRSRPQSVRLAALLVGAAAQFGSVSAGQAAGCSQIGSTYLARPTAVAHPDPRSPPPIYRYQLRIELPPRDTFGSAVAELYRFQTVALRGGKVVSELRMLRICGMGRSPCIVSPPSRPKPDDGYASEEVQLNSDLSIDVREGAPYAIVLPGLPQAEWAPDFVRDWLRADLHFFTREHVTPDLGLQELWVRARCGG